MPSNWNESELVSHSLGYPINSSSIRPIDKHMDVNRTRRLKADPGLAVALLLATFAAWPFLTRPSLPTYTDAELHVYRTYEIMSAWRQGVPYLRWAPDLLFSYGYPIFNYYAPLIYYLAAAYGWFFGGPVAGVKFVLVISIYLGAVGMYLFVRDQWGGRAGMVSAAAFALAPYIVYVNPHWRGAAAEVLAVSLAPGLFWAFWRLRRTATPGNVVIAALLLAAVILAHNVMAFVFTGLLLVWLAWDIASRQLRLETTTATALATPPQRQDLLMWATAVVIGLGLSAFVWLPATLERDAVQFQRAFLPNTHSDFHRHFVEASELFAATVLADTMDLQQPRFKLGLTQWVLGLLGMLTILRKRQWAAAFFAVSALGLIYLMLPGSVRIWEAIPFLAYVQFPWRLLGPSALALAVLVGAALTSAEALLWRWGRVAIGVALVAAFIATALPIMDPLPWPDFGPVTLKRIFLYERDGRGLGTTTGNEFLPVGVKVWPPAPEVDTWLTDTGAADKVDRTALPTGTQVTELSRGPEEDRFLIAGQSGFVLRIFTFYFPGWTAYLNGARTPIGISEPGGLITVAVPPGTHEVLLRLENTPARWLGWGISGLALAALLGVAFLRPEKAATSTSHRDQSLAWREAILFGVVILGGASVRYAADQVSWWRTPAAPVVVPQAQHPHFVRLENNVALLAYDLPQTIAHPGDQAPLTLYWQALAQVPLNLRVFVHFIGPDGQLSGLSDKESPVASFPTTRWPFNRYMIDTHQAVLRPDAPPGNYLIRVGLWDGYTGVRMHVLDAEGNVTDQDGVVLTTNFVVQP